MNRFDLFAKPPYLATTEQAHESLSDHDDVTITSSTSPWPLLPWSRGGLSSAVLALLRGEQGTLAGVADVTVTDPLRDDDFQLALYLCYEIHHRDLTTLDFEWNLELLAFRARLEDIFMTRLRDQTGPPLGRSRLDVSSRIDQLTFAAQRSPIASYFGAGGTLDEFREHCVHRSVGYLREGHPHDVLISRLSGEARAAFVEVQHDHNIRIRSRDSNATLFALTMTALGLDSTYGSYVEMVPGVTLATVNLVSMFSLHRKWRAELVGLLAVLEMNSGESMGNFSRALERWGIGPEGRRFYESHVALDAHHETTARGRLETGLLATDPKKESDVVFGAAAALLLEENFTRHLLDSWERHDSSLVPWELKSSGSTSQRRIDPVASDDSTGAQR